MTIVLVITAIVSIGLMVGTELAVSAFINPILWQLDQNASRQAVRLFARRLGTAMPFWYAGNFLLLVALFLLLRGQPGAALLSAAVGIWGAVIVLTLIFLVPINNRLARSDPDFPPGEAHRQHRRWDAMHRARIAALVAAFVLFLSGLRFG
jgi:uncharacterized membrane protein